MKTKTTLTDQAVFYKDTTVAQIFDIHRSTVWRWAEQGLLPKPVRLSNGVTRWRSSDIDAVSHAEAERVA